MVCCDNSTLIIVQVGLIDDKISAALLDQAGMPELPALPDSGDDTVVNDFGGGLLNSTMIAVVPKKVG